MEIKANIISGTDVFGLSLAEVEFNRKQATPITFREARALEPAQTNGHALTDDADLLVDAGDR